MNKSGLRDTWQSWTCDRCAVPGGADGRGEELSAVAEEIYRGRLEEKRGGDEASDWANAQVCGELPPVGLSWHHRG